MNDISTPTHMSSLATQLQKKLEQDRKEIAELTSNELKQLANDLHTRMKNELHTTAEGIISAHKTLRALIQQENNPTYNQATSLTNCLKMSWIMPPLVSLSLLLTISLGSWGLTRYFAHQIANKLAVMEQLDMRQAKAQKTLDTLTAGTWGIKLLENEQGRWIILPPNLNADTNWTTDERQAIRLEER